MLKIGRKDNDVQMKETLDEGYTDITSVMMWRGVVEKYSFDKTEALKQIELFITSLGENIDEYNRFWYKEHTVGNLFT
jgi:hypothetical protein